MTAPLPQPTSDPVRLCADLDRHGYCIARDLLTPEQAEGVARIVAGERRAALPEERPDGAAIDWDRHGGDEWILLMAGECGLDHLVAHPVALQLARHLLGERVHLSGFSAHVVHPGNEVMGLHTDQWWMPQPVMPGAPAIRPGDLTRESQPHGAPVAADRPIAPAVVINVMWAISDFTAENGATRLVPGSHLSGLHPDRADEPLTVDAAVPAGGAVIWDARTWHASGRNTANAPRIGITATYCAAQFRQLQNFPLGLKPDSYAALSDEMRDLLGFRLFSSYGATDDFTAVHARPGYLRDR